MRSHSRSRSRRRRWPAYVVTGALVAATVGVAGVTPAHASTRTAGTEAAYRSALSALSADQTGPHTLTLTADITLTSGGDPTYTGTQPLTLDGDGHTIDAGGGRRAFARTAHTPVITLTDLVLTGGAAPGGSGGAVLSANGVIQVVNSTLTANSAANGGAVSGGGGVAYLTNSTVTGNTATSSGGGVEAGGVGFWHSTVVANSAPVGANVRTSGNLVGFGSVLAQPLGGGANCAVGLTISDGYNWSTDGSCSYLAAGDHQYEADPQLRALADNGGPTPTRLPTAFSPLVDAIPHDACSATVTSDQRGEPRPWPTGGNCDIGAVERTPLVSADLTASDEAEFRAALDEASFDDTRAHTITLDGDIVLDDGTDPFFLNAQDLTIDGDGHTIDAGGLGRILVTSGTGDVTLRQLDLTGGYAVTGGGIYADYTGTLTVVDSTLHGNTSTASMYQDGGGAIFSGGDLTITNSTLTGNTAAFEAAAIWAGHVEFHHSTVVGNTAPMSAVTAYVVADHTVFSNPGTANCLTASNESHGYNFTNDGSCIWTPTTGDIVTLGLDPQLGPLGDNGGPTRTMMPLATSPLLDAVPSAACSATVTTDQRGVARPQPVGGNCDIGAVEHDGTDPTIDLVTPAEAATYPRDAVVTADYACDDGGIGIASCLGTVADGAPVATGTLGTHPFTVAAVDHEGNEAIVTHTYTVADARPDGRIRRGTSTQRGDDVYGTLTGQTVYGTAAAGGSVTYTASLQNDAPFADTLRVRGAGSTSRFTVRYRDAEGHDITAAVVAGTYTTPTLAPGATHKVKITVTVLRTAPVGASLDRTLKTTSVTQPSVWDKVRASTRRR